MKQETNNEMDLLLRRLGRRDDATVPDADHLDADELSAYAENALPAGARSRYTMHLAECARCRTLVVQLSSSAGVVAATESVSVSEPSGFKKFLASLFTPMVLRYAAPALGLIVVAVIGFVVLRRDQDSKFVAQDTTAQQQRTGVVAPAESPSQNSYDSPANTAANPEKPVERQEKSQPGHPAPPNAAPVVSSIEADVSKDKAAAQPKPEEQAASANEAPPAKPEPSATPEENRRTAETEASKKEVSNLPFSPPPPKKTLQAAERQDKDNLARARRPADSVSAPGTADTAGAGSVAKMQRDGLDDSSAETRSVAGRRFRKQDGVWIDTAYNRSTDPVKLSRGSEQYRALVADEPAIKTIADTLDGEIIVVWKGRTYRIR